MGYLWIRWWWVQAGLVGPTRFHGPRHFVIYLQDDPFGAVFPMPLLILALYDGEGFHDVAHIVSFDAVEVKESGVQLAT